MGKVVECAQVEPSSGCTAVIRGKDEKEVMTKAAEHAKTHGLRQVTPELEAKVRAAIHDE
jgi:predicted small metal-binding protein